jgi:plastocyanin domain-containing protein
MTADRWLVLVFGLGLVAFIVWFFWLKRSTGVRAADVSGGYQEAMILVKGGYTPDTIVVRRGKPVRLNFQREETASCSDKVIFADFTRAPSCRPAKPSSRADAEGAGRVRVRMPDGHVPRDLIVE